MPLSEPSMNAADVLVAQAAALKRMIAELEGTLGVLRAVPITENLLRAYEAIRREQEAGR